MNIKRTLLVTVIVILALNCTEQEERTVCEEYCDVWNTAYTNNANVFECSISNEAMDKFNKECETSCTNAYFSAEDKYHPNIDECLKCLIINTDGEQVPITFQKLMWNRQCQDSCQFTTMFFASFYSIPPICIGN